MQGISCLSGVTLDKLSPCSDIPQRLELYLLLSTSFDFYILVLFSDKLADEIELDSFTDFTASYISVL